MDDLNFTGRVVVITGAAGDLGQAYCEYFAARKAKLVVNARAKPGIASRAEALASTLRAQGAEAVADENALDETGSEDMIGTALAQWGRIDVLIANAGAASAKPLIETSIAAFRETVDTNLWGAVLPSMAALPHMLAAGYGRILLTTSSVGLFGQRNRASYAAAKAGLVGFTRATAFELAKTGVTINAISPYARTAMSRHAIPEGLMGPEQVAPFAGWLVHDSCALSGQIFSVGGGRIRRAAMVEGPVLTPGEDGIAALDLATLTPFTESRNSGQSALDLVPELRGAGG